MFIRTKDGIYEVEWNSYVEMWCDVKTHKGFILDSMISKDDRRLSDSLAELCDEFVIVDLLEKEKPLLIIKSVVKEMMRRTTKTQIYGAIWTSKGLIYVAKMNEKGVLELI